MIDEQSIQLIKQTAAAIQQQSAAINQRAYINLERDHPEAYAILTRAGHPPLGPVVAGYAANIDNLEPFLRHAPKIARVHQRVQLRRAHFDMLGDALFAAMHQVLGTQQLPDDALQAWRGAFTQLANILLQLQAALDQAPAESFTTSDHE